MESSRDKTWRVGDSTNERKITKKKEEGSSRHEKELLSSKREKARRGLKGSSAKRGGDSEGERLRSTKIGLWVDYASREVAPRQGKGLRIVGYWAPRKKSDKLLKLAHHYD